MNGCKGSCITLAAIAGASAAIAGGILAVSSATAGSPKAATLAASNTAVPTSTVVADREALAVSINTPIKSVVQSSNLETFTGTFSDLRTRMRMANMVRVDDQWLENSGTPGSHSGNPGRAGAFDRDAGCTFAPTPPAHNPVAGIWNEDDNYAMPNGSGLDEISPVDCSQANYPATYEGWRGANDMCFPGPGSTDFEDPTLIETINDFTGPGETQVFYGRCARIDNSCYSVSGGDSQNRSKQYDGDVVHFEITAPALDMKIQIIAETDGLWALPLYNFDSVVNGGGFVEITSCDEGFGTYNSWVPQQAKSGTDCGTADVFQESLNGGHWYVLCFPNFNDGPAAGEMSSDGDAWWYEVTISSVNPEGACCDTETGICTDNTLKTVCFGMTGGVFQGAESNCADTQCCSPYADLEAQYGVDPGDWYENDQGTYPDSELICSVGTANTNEGVNQDFFNFDVINCESTPLADPNGGPGFTPADICAGTEYIIVGYSGTVDDFTNAFAADSIDDADSDMFTFEIPGPDPQRVEATFSVPFPYVGYIVSTLGFDAMLQPDCSVAGFASPGIQAPCYITDVTSTLDPGVHGVYLYPFTQAGVSCDTRYTIVIHCLDPAPGACCLKDGMCMDDVVDPVCFNDLHGSFQGEYSSCCASLCEQPCGTANVNPPTNPNLPAGVPDDNCEDYTTYNVYGAYTLATSGDLYNSGCEPSDGIDTEAYWSFAPGISDRLWCGTTGVFVEDYQTGGLQSKKYVTEYDYYELDLSGQADDTQIQITVRSQLPMQVSLLPEKGHTECPTELSEGTTDIRQVTDTITVGSANVGGIQQATLTACVTNDQCILLIESNGPIVDCGFTYTAQLDFEADCMGACCVPGAGCSNLMDDSSTADQAQAACDTLKGTYRGLGTRCPGTGVDASGTTNGGNGNPLDRQTEIECCTVTDDGPADVVDADVNTCTHAFNNDVNGGCAVEPDKPFQLLGNAGVMDWAGVAGPSSISVYGTCGNTVPALGQPTRDRDFYAFTLPAGVDAEMLFSVAVDFTDLVAILDQDDLDPSGACNWSSTSPTSAQLAGGTGANCGTTGFVFSGLDVINGIDNCIDAGETTYVFVSAAREVKCTSHYTFEIELFECQTGACCLDNSLCFGQNDIGFQECEALFGGTFVANASCPLGDLEGTLCLGVCCIDDDMNEATPVICQPGTLYQDCCLGNGALDQLDPEAPGFYQGEWIGYSVGTGTASCAGTPCLATGACCVDSAGGYNCLDNQSAADCATAGGIYAGDDTLCADTPCDAYNGACCVGVSCQADKSPLECTGLTGTFLGAGTDCTGDPCAPAGGACCHACPDGNTCVDVADATACAAAGGYYAGDATSCGSFTCSDIKKGDLDGDGTVTVFDFSIFSSSFGQPGDRCDGDLDCDGTVTVFDFAIFSSDFGQSGLPHPTCP